ncbi:hypothetical protein V5O48_007612 [Marasmius crinis-equi]|uniref:Uncharacterized protein n=1 Tax=Marasmius crinis-equi TaxID=585013 RepID=A0ABR3FGY3_9AGAR
MQLSVKSFAILAAVLPTVIASPLGVVWDEQCGCHKTVTPTPTPTPTTTPCTTTTSSTYVPPTPKVPTSSINTGNHCGQYGTTNNYCFNGGQYNGLTDSCNGGSVYCCQNSPWQNGMFNQNAGNCQSITVNNYGSGSGSGSGSSARPSTTSAGLVGSLLGGLVGNGGLLSGL